jgi:hypothetical protein
MTSKVLCIAVQLRDTPTLGCVFTTSGISAGVQQRTDTQKMKLCERKVILDRAHVHRITD